ncbi:hypothetical protein E4U56_003053 [Claviceps arundinis]|uniref:Uncharacterized protein n=1 Tax=Claviceps arundinis TaxID=1623583 RepID=A0A9P7SNW6_9HYPO|nr:hypothetical protein E4U56_003053 [Claviceps arundinis]
MRLLSTPRSPAVRGSSGERQSIPDTSALNGTNFQPTGFAARKQLKPGSSRPEFQTRSQPSCTLAILIFDIRQDCINTFIARINTLADKTKIQTTKRKGMLLNCLPPGLNLRAIYASQLRMTASHTRASHAL